MKRATFDLENIPPAHESPIHQPCDDNRAKKKQKLEMKPAVEDAEGKLGETGRINCEELLSMPIRNAIQVGNIKATKRHIVHQLRKRADENELLSNGYMEKRFRDIWFEKLVQKVDREFPDMPKGFREDLHPFW